MNKIMVNNISKSYGDLKAVDNISFNVLENELFGLLGPNGAGKSTMISMLSTLIKPDQGEIIIDGFDINKNKLEIKKLIGLVPQDIALYPTLTARENLSFWGKMYGIRKKLLKERISNALDISGLSKRADDRIETYSGGMKRRINIAAALLHDPEILIMDEPTVGIDPQSRNHILDTVLDLNKKGITLIYTSHYMEEVEYLCDKIAIMDNGKIIAIGTKDELVNLVTNKDTVVISGSNFTQKLAKKIESIEGIDEVFLYDEDLKIISTDSKEILSNIINEIEKNHFQISEIKIDKPNLEAVFLHLTGKALRD